MASIQCDQCGKTFLARARGGRFCSRTCFGLDRRGRSVWAVPTLVRFWGKVDKRRDGDCWPWSGFKQPSGHGQFAIRSKATDHVLIAAHRFMWMLTHGPIPDGMKVCHRCDNGACVNPKHLFLGTQADNLRDMRDKDRHSRGERHGNAKFCDEDVLAIRELASSGVSQSDIARRFNTRQSEISNIVRGKRWKHLLGKVA